jgi:hypothetical protein
MVLIIPFLFKINTSHKLELYNRAAKWSGGSYKAKALYCPLEIQTFLLNEQVLSVFDDLKYLIYGWALV